MTQAEWYREPRWTGPLDSGDVRWGVDVDHDKFSDNEPHVVCVELFESDKREQYLATLTPEQAREVAAALVKNAGVVQSLRETGRYP
jgi:hypothetical protein